jgi:hypothetical protein
MVFPTHFSRDQTAHNKNGQAELYKCAHVAMLVAAIRFEASGKTIGLMAWSRRCLVDLVLRACVV